MRFLDFRIRWLITKTEEDFADLCQFVAREGDCLPPYVNMPWTDVVLACVNHKLTQIDYSDPMAQQV